MRRWILTAAISLLVGCVLGVTLVALVLRDGSDHADDVAGLGGDLDAEAEETDPRSDGPWGRAALQPPEFDAPAVSEPESDLAEAEPFEPPEPDPPPAPELLVAHLQALLSRDDLAAVDNASVIVLDEVGREVAAHRPDHPVTPASTAKLFTAAAALRLLGPDYRYVTRLYADGEIEEATLRGDLVIVGSGDPALASPTYIKELYPARPHTHFDLLAAAVEEAGITRITGSVRGDPAAFEDEPVATGWRDRYFASLDASMVSGLTVDAGRRLFERNDQLLAEAADVPALEAADVFTRLLDERDIRVDGEAAVGPLPTGAIEIGRVRSPPLARMLTHVVQRSDNHMADGVFRTLGAVAERGTWAASDRTVRAALADLDMDWSPIVLEDGSGLSRESKLTARSLAELDRVMITSGYDWSSLMAVSGESGTLRTRLQGTAAHGRLYGKTGALQDARSLAGHVHAADGRRYHFAILGSELDGAGIQAVRTLMDDVALLLAAALPACLPEQMDDEGLCA